ncbi:MAG: type II toxin-antitoxin system Phd/YefM family antitoxin [Propionibacteriaceae bacterium]|jgi:prevent-host-death family protein|nr:type II toxin-antitoxin system Phd/YefM family antitoxin [Propionibacteriaceae bacterium]
MIAEVNAVTFRQRLGEMLAHVQYGGDTIIVTRDGDRVAALIDSALFDQIRALRSRFDELCGVVAAGYAGTPETEGLAEIDAVADAVRHGR